MTFPSKATHQQTRADNASLVLRALYDFGPMSRADVARLSGLTRTTVCDVIGEGWATRPKLGLWPTRPQNAAGMRIEPPPSLAWATATIPLATAAAEPPLDPPADRLGSQGLRQGP